MRAIRLASQMVIQEIEQRARYADECDESAIYVMEWFRNLLTLARTRAGAAEDLEANIAEGLSIGRQVAMLRHLPEIGPAHFETAPQFATRVDMPGGGASASRRVH
jgi:hypothetical protein